MSSSEDPSSLVTTLSSDDTENDHHDKNNNSSSNSSSMVVTSSSPLRRSKRDIHAIKLSHGSINQTFFRNLRILFFNPRTTTATQLQDLLLKGRRSSNSNDTDSSSHIPSVKRVTNRRQAPIYVLDNFLTRSELDYFDEKIRQQKNLTFERSFVDNMNCDQEEEEVEEEGNTPKTKKARRTSTLVDDTHRTSTFYSFGKLQDTRIAALEQRIAALLGCWVHQIEPLQLVRYAPGQFFGVHHDMGDLLENDTVALPPKNIAVKRRLVTLFCYLNTLQEHQGGATYFPQCGHLRVTPQKGRAVLWSNVTAEGQPDPRTVHAGEAVHNTGGTNDGDVVKYGLNIWICEE